MEAERLIYMANQIARNFEALGHDEAALATADHIKMYWDPRMLAGIRAVDPADMSPLAARAIAMLDGPVPHMTRATEFASADENDPGYNDAG
ncbi:formate dehydrogenase subunit delta [Sphingobium sp. B2D3A]|uniref:formate dehydrogenase subunit delta n=1 Tax=unclassified Sphingobium TaxID=2611147 RepID=UPI002224D83E|nr:MULTISPECIES: formate dehydrogenase subunit delta [unclassified Sphingobium]MCW2338356.1 formate dehydrogenase subunit delta [Sphingobium sp. B2D3A]MCW2369277.1 formate dehydrogenase subunit delta [Sphingobium sp. B11D3D]MCW2384814.1 formate dehydrogenase subunit delta [Sphingobium sp. B2D3D]